MSAAQGLPRASFTQIARLATRDLLHQKLASAVLMLSLAAVLTPLLVLFGLKYGVVDNLVRELVEDPRNREIRLIGHGRFDAQWFARVAARPDVAFVVPRTRGAAASIDLRSADSDELLNAVELIPSAPGDPLLQGHAQAPASIDSVVVSAQTARLLRVAPGDTIQGSVRRKRDGRWSRVQVALRVAARVPDAVFARRGIFVSPALLTAVEDFRDGYAVPELGWNEGQPFTGDRRYSGFRLYARGLDDVARLRDWLADEGRGFEAATNARAIEEVKLLDRYLTATFAMIAFIGVTGYLLSFGASMWVNVDRKRRELSVLQLLGFRSPVIMLFPVIQSALIALGGGVLAIVLFTSLCLLINGYFAREAGQFEGLCRLLPSHLLISLAVTLLCAMLSSTLAAYRSTRIEPSQGLRDL